MNKDPSDRIERRGASATLQPEGSDDVINERLDAPIIPQRVDVLDEM